MNHSYCPKPGESWPRDALHDSGEIKSAELLGPRREVVINHDGQRYSLRLTSKGKLILTK